MYESNATPGEQNKARRIIRLALAADLAVSVADGEGGWMVKRSRDPAAIWNAIGEMEMDELVFRGPDGERVGWMMLVWGNAADGSELAADYTGNLAMGRLADA